MRTLVTRPHVFRLCAGAVLASSLAGGCYYPGGSMVSGGASTYESTPYLPATVTILDTRTREELVSFDVPVGKQLVIDFDPGEAPGDDNALPDAMRWEIMDTGIRYGGLANVMPVPAAEHRLVRLDYRPAPELAPTPPPGSGPAPVPSPLPPPPPAG